jgi:hypothetical protein
MVVFTITCANYLPKAVVLARAVKRHHPEATVECFLLETERQLSFIPPGVFDRVHLPEALGIPNPRQMLFWYSILEASTAVKASAFLTCLIKHPSEDLFVYLDPDVMLLSPMEELFSLPAEASIIVTPHHLTDESTNQATADNIYRTLMCGIFNLGFLAIRRSSEASAFLAWWNSRLMYYCTIDFDHGLFVDQKWLDFAMSFFDLYVLREPGYNVANWNISQRSIGRTREGEFLANGRPLRFIHFSSIDSGKDLRTFRRYAKGSLRAISLLRNEYKRLCNAEGQTKIRNHPWSFDYYSSGERIVNDARVAYRKNPRLRARYPDPFVKSNETFLGIGW